QARCRWTIAQAHIEVTGFADITVDCECSRAVAAIALIAIHFDASLCALGQARDVWRAPLGYTAIHLKRQQRKHSRRCARGPQFDLAHVGVHIALVYGEHPAPNREIETAPWHGPHRTNLGIGCRAIYSKRNVGAGVAADAQHRPEGLAPSFV